MSYAARLKQPDSVNNVRMQEQAEARAKLLTTTMPEKTAMTAEAEKQSELELLKGIRKTVAETDDISTRTVETLHAQTEQINRIKEDTEAIEHNLDTSQYLLRGLKSWGWFKNMFEKTPPAVPPAASKTSTRPSESGAPGHKAAPPPAASASTSSSTARHADRLIAEEAKRRKAQEDAEAAANPDRKLRPDQRDPEAQKALDDISLMLDGIKMKTQDIKGTLDHHNQVLPDVVASMETSQERMRKQKEEMKRLR